MKHIFISLIVLLAIGGAYIGYEVMSVQKAFSPTNPELVGPGTKNAIDNAKPTSNPANIESTEFEETRDFGDDGQEDDMRTTTGSYVQTTPTKSPTNTTTQTSAKTYTLADIAKHANASSCYTAVRGTVYDLTNFITKHPGGAENILKICGKDGTSAFTRKHAGRPEPEQELAGHEIGKLAK